MLKHADPCCKKPRPSTSFPFFFEDLISLGVSRCWDRSAAALLSVTIEKLDFPRLAGANSLADSSADARSNGVLGGSDNAPDIFGRVAEFAACHASAETEVADAY